MNTVLKFDDGHEIEVKAIEPSPYHLRLDQVLRNATLGQKFAIAQGDLIIELAVTNITSRKT